MIDELEIQVVKTLPDVVILWVDGDIYYGKNDGNIMPIRMYSGCGDVVRMNSDTVRGLSYHSEDGKVKFPKALFRDAIENAVCPLIGDQFIRTAGVYKHGLEFEDVVSNLSMLYVTELDAADTEARSDYKQACKDAWFMCKYWDNGVECEAEFAACELFYFDELDFSIRSNMIDYGEYASVCDQYRIDNGDVSYDVLTYYIVDFCVSSKTVFTKKGTPVFLSESDYTVWEYGHKKDETTLPS